MIAENFQINLKPPKEVIDNVFEQMVQYCQMISKLLENKDSLSVRQRAELTHNMQILHMMVIENYWEDYDIQFAKNCLAEVNGFLTNTIR